MKKIKYSGKKDSDQFFLVSDESFDFVNNHKWYLHHRGYAITSIKDHTGKRKLVKLHRLLMNFPVGMHVDHKDGNKSNYQLNNLRVATKNQNERNRPKRPNCSSIYKGVYWNKTYKRWYASITLDNKLHYLGSFTNELAAAIAYNEKAKEFHGEFAVLNSF